ncbi:hypothetical protein I3U63_05995 [Mycobacteroides abscessus subsp. massiliense]|uniref:hypothetical protein n=1 Tax=Mycobacteroides abscessus TaxID=36809 RepID=UPI0019CF99E3|nr:hypothetical protein [Mycobacteroides abscessus]MBN7321058.1 hypothetical protein [Mycobacteroides abscessus subsp. massiliense]
MPCKSRSARLVVDWARAVLWSAARLPLLVSGFPSLRVALGLWSQLRVRSRYMGLPHHQQGWPST